MTPKPAPSNPLLAAARLLALACANTLLLILYLLRRALVRDPTRRLHIAVQWIRAWCRCNCAIMGLRWQLHGQPPRGPCLLTPNHLGYVDFLVLGAAFPCFILSRADLLGWPGIAALVASSENPRVSRGRGRDVQQTAAQMRQRLHAGHAILVFLEGTSSAGDRVLPFMPSFLQPAIDTKSPIIPIGLTWHAPDPRIDIAEDVAFWKDHAFGPHTWRLLGLRGLNAQIHIGQPIPTHDPNKTRRDLAQQTRQAVAQLANRPELELNYKE